tara:strand:+ start:825 stop:1808 length:984 start_codon:yes stop_codon:yes gene_type:complete
MAPEPTKVKGKTDVNQDGEVNSLDDLNNDGRANKADLRLDQDRISNELIGRDYQTAARLLQSDPFIRQLFETAIQQRQPVAAFEAALKNSDWYLERGEDFRKAWFSKTLGGADWEDQMEQARDAVGRQAVALGAVLSAEEVEKFAEDYIFNRWDKPNRLGLLNDALASKVQADQGSQIAVRDALFALAQDNGVSVSDQWFNEASQSIARGDSTQADQEMWIREQAAAKHPLYADKIRGGLTVKALASPYTQRMAEILELNADGISLDDPLIGQALGGVDAQGNPMAMSYTDFENLLRQDPRWETTKNGMNTLMNTVTSFSKSWGFVK